MSDTALILIIVAAAVILGAWFLWRRKKSARLQEEFGNEYARAVREKGGKREAEKELEERKKRVREYELRSLSSREREEFARRWREIQTRFVDEPSAAIEQAQELCEEVMEARGYPIGDPERMGADVSVEHADVVRHYRLARDIADAHRKGEASTEDLRQATKHYRELFDALLEGERTETEAKG